MLAVFVLERPRNPPVTADMLSAMEVAPPSLPVLSFWLTIHYLVNSRYRDVASQ